MGRKTEVPHLDELDNGSLIPGLPNDIAILCLLKVPRLHHFSLRAVCRLWSSVLRSPRFYEGRKQLGVADAWLVVLSTDLMASTQLFYTAYDLQSKQLLFKARLSPSSLLQKSGVDCFRMEAIDECLLLLGGKRAVELSPILDQMFVYNTVTNKWKQGKRIGVGRSCFASGVINGLLYVTGGLNGQGKVEQTTEVYDAKADEWRRGASMPGGLQKIEGDVVFEGKLFVMGCGSEKEEMRRVWVYEPEADEWEEERRMARRYEGGGREQLAATKRCIYNLSYGDGLQKFGRDGHWRGVGQASCSSSKLQCTFNRSSQRVFGYGNELFLLTGGAAGRTSSLLSDEDGAKCHSLFLGASWYRAGAIVLA